MWGRFGARVDPHRDRRASRWMAVAHDPAHSVVAVWDVVHGVESRSMTRGAGTRCWVAGVSAVAWAVGGRRAAWVPAGWVEGGRWVV